MIDTEAYRPYRLRYLCCLIANIIFVLLDKLYNTEYTLRFSDWIIVAS
ncbi:MAG: hypothetical protein LBH59_10410 [Planctomycetaceae bacterium]|nr:hypothetical protein [Planctomycetaceae bacterium]